MCICCVWPVSPYICNLKLYTIVSTALLNGASRRCILQKGAAVSLFLKTDSTALLMGSHQYNYDTHLR